MIKLTLMNFNFYSVDMEGINLVLKYNTKKFYFYQWGKFESNN